MIKVENVKLSNVGEPMFGLPKEMPKLSDNLYKSRLGKVLDLMAKLELDYMIIYADREHYGNFEYLTGFGPRFEEAILVLDKVGKAHLLLGNECLNMVNFSRIEAEGILYHTLSLPNQPMGENKKLEDILSEIGIKSMDKVGLVGWKLIYPVYGDKYMYDLPSFIVEGVKALVNRKNIINSTDLFIHPDYGVRIINSAEEIAYFEFGASYASDAVQQILLNTRTGLTEIEISQFGTAGSLPTSCFPKVLSGPAIDINMTSPTTYVAQLGDRFQVTMGLIGGQSNRRGFLAYGEEDLPEESKDWLEKVAKPYFAVASNWYEQVGIGVVGKEIYDMVESTYPKAEYGWFLNPGHLIDIEEWVSSPIYEDSEIEIKSGMCFQMDIIPSVESKYAAPDFEDGLAIADESLRKELEEKFPETYERIQARRRFMIDVLKINIKPELLPLSNIAGLYRPYMLNKDKAFIIER